VVETRLRLFKLDMLILGVARQLMEVCVMCWVTNAY
jgi:hypothetical protein